MADDPALEEFLSLAAGLGLREASYSEMMQEVEDVVRASGVSDPDKAIESLREYRLIEPADVRYGAHVRWIRSPEASASGETVGPTSGGFVTGVTPQDNGETTIRCHSPPRRHVQLTTRPGLYVFQQLSEQEIMVLSVLARLDESSTEER